MEESWINYLRMVYIIMTIIISGPMHPKINHCHTVTDYRDKRRAQFEFETAVYQGNIYLYILVDRFAYINMDGMHVLLLLCIDDIITIRLLLLKECVYVKCACIACKLFNQICKRKK